MSATMQLYGDELLAAVFANFSTLSKGFKTTEGNLISIFYGLLKEKEYEPLARQYPFDADGIEPRSKALSDAFDSLQQSRLIGRLNPDLVMYTISDALRVRYQKFIAPKLRDEESLVKKLAAQVEAELAPAR